MRITFGYPVQTGNPIGYPSCTQIAKVTPDGHTGSPYILPVVPIPYPTDRFVEFLRMSSAEMLIVARVEQFQNSPNALVKTTDNSPVINSLSILAVKEIGKML